MEKLIFKFIVFLIIVQNTVSQECDLSRIFRTPKDMSKINMDHFEIIERGNFDQSDDNTHETTTNEQPGYTEATPKSSIANCQVLLRFGGDNIQGHNKFYVPPQCRRYLDRQGDGNYYAPKEQNTYYPPVPHVPTPIYYPYPPPSPYTFPNYYYQCPGYLPPALQNYYDATGTNTDAAQNCQCQDQGNTDTSVSTNEEQNACPDISQEKNITPIKNKHHPKILQTTDLTDEKVPEVSLEDDTNVNYSKSQSCSCKDNNSANNDNSEDVEESDETTTENVEGVTEGSVDVEGCGETTTENVQYVTEESEDLEGSGETTTENVEDVTEEWSEEISEESSSEEDIQTNEDEESSENPITVVDRPIIVVPSNSRKYCNTQKNESDSGSDSSNAITKNKQTVSTKQSSEEAENSTSFEESEEIVEAKASSKARVTKKSSKTPASTQNTSSSQESEEIEAESSSKSKVTQKSSKSSTGNRKSTQKEEDSSSSEESNEDAVEAKATSKSRVTKKSSKSPVTTQIEANTSQESEEIIEAESSSKSKVTQKSSKTSSNRKSTKGSSKQSSKSDVSSKKKPSKALRKPDVRFVIIDANKLKNKTCKHVEQLLNDALVPYSCKKCNSNQPKMLVSYPITNNNTSSPRVLHGDSCPMCYRNPTTPFGKRFLNDVDVLGALDTDKIVDDCKCKKCNCINCGCNMNGKSNRPTNGKGFDKDIDDLFEILILSLDNSIPVEVQTVDDSSSVGNLPEAYAYYGNQNGAANDYIPSTNAIKKYQSSQRTTDDTVYPSYQRQSLMPQDSYSDSYYNQDPYSTQNVVQKRRYSLPKKTHQHTIEYLQVVPKFDIVPRPDLQPKPVNLMPVHLPESYSPYNNESEYEDNIDDQYVSGQTIPEQRIIYVKTLPSDTSYIDSTANTIPYENTRVPCETSRVSYENSRPVPTARKVVVKKQRIVRINPDETTYVDQSANGVAKTTAVSEAPLRRTRQHCSKCGQPLTLYPLSGNTAGYYCSTCPRETVQLNSF